MTETSYSTDEMQLKGNVLRILDSNAVGICKDRSIGQPAVNIVGNKATLQVEQLNMQDLSASSHSLSCAVADCASTVQAIPHKLIANGINAEVCLSAGTVSDFLLILGV